MAAVEHLLPNHLPKKKYFLQSFLHLLLGVLSISFSYAHPSPNSLIFLDVSPSRVAMEVQLPVPELELAFNRPLSSHTETLLQQYGSQLTQYILAHIHAYVTKDKPWQIEFTSLQMDSANYVDTHIPYREVIAHLILKPQTGDDTRKFFLEYDVIMHQVVTHTALLSLRSDWENGTLESSINEAGIIRWRLSDNRVEPVEISLEKGSRWKGFKSMFALGMQHIKEGTDHLMFLLVLLLPCMLLFQGANWGKFGGIKFSVKHLLQIVTAFTIGHSITLLMSAAGWVQLPSQPVEILIAFSIFVSAIHAIYPLFPGKEMYVAAGFGLVHGLAFAAILTNMRLNASTLAISVVGFNLGIEVMQLFIVLLTVPWLILLSTTAFYKRIRIGGGILAAIAALAWVAERSLGKPNQITSFIQSTTQYAGWGIAALAIASVLFYFISKKRKMSN